MNLTELNVKEENLFADWQKHSAQWGKQFIKDGIIDFNEYQKTDPRILFLFKEANDKEKKNDWDLRHGLEEGGKPASDWRNWDVVARWIYAISAKSRLNWKELTDTEKTVNNDSRNELGFRKEQLRKVAVVNIKKISGVTTTNEKELYAYAKECHPLVCKQIALYKPNLIICGGTFGIAKDIIFPKGQGQCKIRIPTQNGIEWFTWTPLDLISWSCDVVEYAHFGARISPKILHFPLVDACHEILERKKMVRYE